MTVVSDPYSPPPKRPRGRVFPDLEGQAANRDGMLIAAQAAREKAAHEAYNDPLALAARLAAELDPPAPEPEPEPEPEPVVEPVKPQRGKRTA